MADQKLSELTEATALSASSELYAVIGGASRKIQWDSALQSIPIGPVVTPQVASDPWFKAGTTAISTTAATDFSFNISPLVNTGITDGAYHRFGINVDQNGDPVVASEASVFWEMQNSKVESGEDTMFASLNVVDTQGNRLKVFEALYSRDDVNHVSESFFAVNASHVTWHNSTVGLPVMWKFDFANLKTFINGGQTLEFDTNNVAMLSQKKVAAGFANILYLNDSDETLVGTGSDAVRLAAQLILNGGSNNILPNADGEGLTFGSSSVRVNRVDIYPSGTEAMRFYDNAGTARWNLNPSAASFAIRDETTFNKLLELDASAPSGAIRLRSSGGLGIGTPNVEGGLTVSASANGGGIAMHNRAAPGGINGGTCLLYADSM